MKNSKTIKYLIVNVLVLIMIATVVIYTYPKQKDITQTPEEKMIYIQQECSPKKCEQNNFELINTPSQNILNAKVFGTIYEDRDNATIWGTCSNSENKPLESNASITIYNPNSSMLVNQTNMTKVNTGIFNLSVGLTATRGNYLVMLNCSTATDYAVAYAEFQNPSWVNKLQTILNDIGNVLSATTNKKDFRIDKLTAVSPIYPNETIHIEATFSDGNGSLATPDEINLTILYPNRTQFIYKSKSNFATSNNVWNYSETTLSNQKTGTYYVHLQANDSGNRKSIKTIQFRVATGGPYRLALDCTAIVETGATLSCTVDITDEGEIATESTTTIWVDTDGDSGLGATEPQVSFSKKTSPQQIVSESTTINIPSSHATGAFVVRAKTSYSGSPQPDTTASDSITIIAKAVSVGGEGDTSGGGSSGTSSNCNRYIIAYNECYYFNGNVCIKGCHSNLTCKDLSCVASDKALQPTLKPILSPLQRFWDWIKGLLGLSLNNSKLSVLEASTVPTISPQPEQQLIKEKITQAFQQNKWLPYIIIGIVVIGFAVYVFGWWQPVLAFIMGLGYWGYIIIAIILIILYLFIKNF